MRRLPIPRPVISLLRPAPVAPALPPGRVDPEYRRLRLQVFLGIFIGYAAFYLVRKNFALAMPDILKQYPQYSKAALGSAMTGLSIAFGVSFFHDWGAIFYFNAVIAAACAGAVALLLRDTPQSCGLPSIEHYKNDYPPDYSADHERILSFREIFFGYVLNNKFLWAIAVANAFVYFVRYGVVDWIPTYLQTAKGFSFQQSSLAWSAFEYAAVPGTILCGWISDKVFKGRRAPATILFMALTLVALVVYGLNRHGPLWIDMASLIAIGFFIYGPIMIIGLHALDLVPKKAAGTAAGFTGFFGYVFGSAIAGAGVGWIADKWGWGGVFATMIACCVLTMVFSAMTLGHRTTSAEAAK